MLCAGCQDAGGGPGPSRARDPQAGNTWQRSSKGQTWVSCVCDSPLPDGRILLRRRLLVSEGQPPTPSAPCAGPQLPESAVPQMSQCIFHRPEQRPSESRNLLVFVSANASSVSGAGLFIPVGQRRPQPSAPARPAQPAAPTSPGGVKSP